MMLVKQNLTYVFCWKREKGARRHPEQEGEEWVWSLVPGSNWTN